MKCSQHNITPALKCEPRRRKVPVSQNKTFPSRSVEILSPGCWNPCLWEYSAPSTPSGEVKCWQVDVNSRMVFGDVSHEEVGGSKSISQCELGFLQAERSESQQRCSSDLRAALEHFTGRIIQIPQNYIYICLRLYSLQDNSDVQNKEFLYLLYMRSAKVSTRHIITSKTRNY